MRSTNSELTSTLMEAQEFGEMMEHVDEVNFALDGLRAGQPVRIRRASLLSLLSVCASAQQRRLLRSRGLVKKMIDAVLGLSVDDSPSCLAAAALFYTLASDGQDEHLLDSPTCIRFLLKLLNPPISDTVEAKALTFGSKLLSVHGESGMSSAPNKRLDPSTAGIASKVQEILLSCKEIKSWSGNDDGMERPELNAKWIVLLTMEKACLSTVSFEDTSGTVGRVGGHFKERLRELGGLDAIFDAAIRCHTIMEGWLKSGFSPVSELKDNETLQGLSLLLKCLKVMENATFLSKENQNHLLGMNSRQNSKGSPLSFVGLITSAIKTFSDISLLQSSCNNSNNAKYGCRSDASEVQLKDGCKAGQDRTSSSSSARSRGMKKAYHEKKNFSFGQKLQMSSVFRSVIVSETSNASHDDYHTRKQSYLHASVSSNRQTWSGLNESTSVNAKGSKTISVVLGKRPRSKGDIRGKSIKENCDPFAFGEDELELNGDSIKDNHDPFAFGEDGLEQNGDVKGKSHEENHDPFAFDEDDVKPSKWELLSTKKEPPQTRRSMEIDKELEMICDTILTSSNTESINGGNSQSSCSVVEDDSSLLGDCLLTAVKVLMNLTNDNPVGCRKIAACGGLDTMAALIVNHFPSFSYHQHNQLKENVSMSKSQMVDTICLKDKHLNDQELDFLVAILGLLVNLVEKDSENRSRLATSSVLLPRGKLVGDDTHRDVIPLLCSIFLANQGAGEGKSSPHNDETVLLQGEREAEMMIIEAYSALLLAFLSTESSKNAREAIANCLPEGDLEVLVPVLERFVEFHLSLNMISPETHSAVTEVIQSCRGP
ncbi:hypothetical protein QJS10_CPA09g01583 [Acorus calamus]|uniref:Wings apart-like protein C-terminal domain-containing protein n=1 Tax=Acorus calamus TaxID=4465 RepID=A0AAV9E889_ACOCL|nr:hypothetical protein QJS10_CPA09g01583 [Acorus calamus]